MRSHLLAPLSLLLAIVIATAPCMAAAQTMEDSSSLGFEAPFGMQHAGNMELVVNGSRDSALNKVVSASPGWGFSATAIGNLVNVVTQGSNNTVVLNTSQINRGSQQATLATPFGAHGDPGRPGGLPDASADLTGVGSYLDLR